MKRHHLKYLLSAALILLPVLCNGQGKIFTRSARLADFPTKTTKVVLSGNEMLDAPLMMEVSSRWRISPFEFCGPEDFATLKDDSSYYFLYLSSEKSGVAFLTLQKGGNNESFGSMDSKFEVVRIPISPVQLSTGREMVFFPAMIDLVQIFVEESMLSETRSYLRLSSYNTKRGKLKKKKVYIAREDICSDVSGLDSLVTIGQVVIEDAAKVDSLFLAGEENSLVAFSISSEKCGPRAMSYQMVVSADTHELYFYGRRRYREAKHRGFSKRELKSL